MPDPNLQIGMPLEEWQALLIDRPIPPDIERATRAWTTITHAVAHEMGLAAPALELDELGHRGV